MEALTPPHVRHTRTSGGRRAMPLPPQTAMNVVDCLAEATNIYYTFCVANSPFNLGLPSSIIERIGHKLMDLQHTLHKLLGHVAMEELQLPPMGSPFVNHGSLDQLLTSPSAMMPPTAIAQANTTDATKLHEQRTAEANVIRHGRHTSINGNDHHGIAVVTGGGEPPMISLSDDMGPKDDANDGNDSHIDGIATQANGNHSGDSSGNNTTVDGIHPPTILLQPPSPAAGTIMFATPPMSIVPLSLDPQAETTPLTPSVSTGGFSGGLSPISPMPASTGTTSPYGRSPTATPSRRRSSAPWLSPAMSHAHAPNAPPPVTIASGTTIPPSSTMSTLSSANLPFNINTSLSSNVTISASPTLSSTTIGGGAGRTGTTVVTPSSSPSLSDDNIIPTTGIIDTSSTSSSLLAPLSSLTTSMVSSSSLSTSTSAASNIVMIPIAHSSSTSQLSPRPFTLPPLTTSSLLTSTPATSSSSAISSSSSSSVSVTIGLFGQTSSATTAAAMAAAVLPLVRTPSPAIRGHHGHGTQHGHSGGHLHHIHHAPHHRHDQNSSGGGGSNSNYSGTSHASPNIMPSPSPSPSPPLLHRAELSSSTSTPFVGGSHHHDGGLSGSLASGLRSPLPPLPLPSPLLRGLSGGTLQPVASPSAHSSNNGTGSGPASPTGRTGPSFSHHFVLGSNAHGGSRRVSNTPNTTRGGQSARSLMTPPPAPTLAPQASPAVVITMSTPGGTGGNTAASSPISGAQLTAPLISPLGSPIRSSMTTTPSPRDGGTTVGSTGGGISGVNGGGNAMIALASPTVASPSGTMPEEFLAEQIRGIFDEAATGTSFDTAPFCITFLMSFIIVVILMMVGCECEYNSRVSRDAEWQLGALSIKSSMGKPSSRCHTRMD
jgi:hypothetical protein